MDGKESLMFSALHWIGKLIPGDYLKTFVYLNCIAAPRQALRKSLNSFYRMDHIYEVLREFKKLYRGKFSMLEFGVADGYAFTKKLYATQYMKMEDRVMVHGFDTFEGLPKQIGHADDSFIHGRDWIESSYRGSYEDLRLYCESKYKNFQLHKGLFEDTLTPAFLKTLEEYPPILIWIDCDYYTSTRTVFERLITYIPSGCVIYFDDIYYNFSSRFTGEMKVLWEINQGNFGDGIELVLDRGLSWDSNRIYRFINVDCPIRFELIKPIKADLVRKRADDSPFP